MRSFGVFYASLNKQLNNREERQVNCNTLALICGHLKELFEFGFGQSNQKHLAKSLFLTVISRAPIYEILLDSRSENYCVLEAFDIINLLQ